MASAVSVSIVTFNHGTFIGPCLDTLLKAHPQFPLQVLVWDNGSQDTTQDILKKQSVNDPRIQVIHNKINIGFGKAHNKLLEKANSQYHFVCNPDVEFLEPTFESMVKALEEDSSLGLICPRVEFPDGTLQQLNKRDPRVLDLAVRRLLPPGIQSLFQERIDHYEMRDMSPNQSYEVPFVSGCFFGIRTELMRKLNGFDERFFAYFEDADLSRRIRDQGFRNLYYPQARIRHHWLRANRSSLRGSRIFIQSALKYFGKWGWRL